MEFKNISAEKAIAYDNLLINRLNHLKEHPNYLPHIGKNFEQTSQRLIIVGESHYIAKEYDGIVTADSWHNEPEKIYSAIGEFSRWFNTRGVLEGYFYNKSKGKVFGGLTIFLNLEKAYKTVFKEIDLFDECVYINYFQRPAEKQGDSIKIHPKDSKIALENLLTLIDILKLDKIIFVSSKAHIDFIANTTKEQRDKLPYVGAVPHPSASSWWNRASKKYGINGDSVTGKAKFIRIIKQ